MENMILLKTIGVRSFWLMTLLLYFHPLNAQHLFTKAQVLEDMTFLKSSLEDAHYNLYAYTSKQEFDRNYKEVRRSITKDSISLLEATALFQKIISKANNGHTSLDFPGQLYGEYAYAGGTVFPLELSFEDETYLIRKNWSHNHQIDIGAELLSINGIPMGKILLDIYPLISAERLYFKKAKIEAFSFPRYYWFAFGGQDSFEVDIRSNGRIKKYLLKAVEAVDGYEMKRAEVINAAMKLEFMENSVYLNPGDFGGDEEAYQVFIDSAFLAIRDQKSKNLIIDLRNNPGGNDSFSDYLISYFANKPFKWCNNFTLKTSEFLKAHTRKNFDTTAVFWEQVLTHQNGEIYDYEFDLYQPQPKARRFKGDVYILVNRQSYSQSAVAAAQIQDYGFGTIVGEETGEYPSLYASIFQYSLPNTGIGVKLPKGYIVRVNGSTKKEGVIPDIRIKDHLLDEEDEILNALLKRLSNK